jgi:hypothetical protein
LIGPETTAAFEFAILDSNKLRQRKLRVTSRQFQVNLWVQYIVLSGQHPMWAAYNYYKLNANLLVQPLLLSERMFRLGR